MSGGRSALLWLALGVALSASLVDLAGHFIASPWARGSALFLLLFAWAAWTDPGPARPARDGFVWLALGLAVSLVCVAGGMTRAGRPGVALAAIGLARALGRPSPSRALLALWIVPVPSALLAALAPGLAGLVATAAAHAASLAGVVARVDTSRADSIALSAPAGVLDLFPGDDGLPLAWALAGIGWFAAVQYGRSVARALRCAAAFGLAALPIQIAVLALACAISLAGGSAFARGALDHSVMVLVPAALLVATAGARRGVLRARAGAAS